MNLSFKKTKIKLYIDIDDCIINTIESTVKFINNKLNIIPPKTESDVLYWKGFKEIGDIHITELENFWESDKFFQDITIDEDFKKYFINNNKKFDWEFLTIGTKRNLLKKHEYLKNTFNDLMTNNNVTYTGIISHYNQKDKSHYINNHCNQKQLTIQIDDNYDNLKKSNVNLKILIKNYYDREYNQTQPCDDIYIVNTWKEIIDILNFYLKNQDMLKEV